MWENPIPPECRIDHKDQDLIGFGPDARQLVSAVLKVQPPFTIGVVGPWGSGKTSLMKLSQSMLGGIDGVVDVWFDAWKYGRLESLLPALIFTLRQAAEEISPEKAGKFKKVARVASLMTADLAVRGVSGGLGAPISIKEIKKLIKEFGAQPGDELLADVIAANALHELFQSAVASLLTDSSGEFPQNKRRLCVFIDDLDRCSPEQAMRFIEDLHLFLAVDGVVFVLGMSTNSVKVALKAKYGEDSDLVDEYLQKLILFELDVPESSQNLSELARIYSNKLYGVDAKELSNIAKGIAYGFSVIGENNPRLLKRLIRHLAVKSIELSRLPEKIRSDLIGLLIAGRAVWPEFVEYLVEPSRNANHFALWFDAKNRPRAIADQSIPAASVAVFEKYEHAGKWYMDARRLCPTIWTDDRSIVASISKIVGRSR